MSRSKLSLIALVSYVAALTTWAVAQAQTPQAPWSGWARCEITVTGQGYNDQQTHTWMISGSSSVVTGAFRVYPATWSVVGSGSGSTHTGQPDVDGAMDNERPESQRAAGGIRARLRQTDVHPGKAYADASTAFCEWLPAAHHRRQTTETDDHCGRSIRVVVSCGRRVTTKAGRSFGREWIEHSCGERQGWLHATGRNASLGVVHVAIWPRGRDSSFAARSNGATDTRCVGSGE